MYVLYTKLVDESCTETISVEMSIFTSEIVNINFGFDVVLTVKEEDAAVPSAISILLNVAVFADTFTVVESLVKNVKFTPLIASERNGVNFGKVSVEVPT